MKKIANFSLPFLTILFSAGFMMNVQAQNYATAVSLKETKTTNPAKNTNFVAPTMTPVSFPGGTEAWNQYLTDNLVYPLKARENAIEGKVIARFWVNTNGQAETIEIQESLGYGCDEEVKRLIEESPRWNPALQGSYPVKTRMVVTVQFGLKD